MKHDELPKGWELQRQQEAAVAELNKIIPSALSKAFGGKL
jgi:hypothetical protein